MLILLAPSKTMDVSSPLPFQVEETNPPFSRQSMEVFKTMAALRPYELAGCMKMSATLAEKSWQQYHVTKTQTKPALWAYVGDVYRGVQAATMTPEDAAWAQDHLVIASAMFGLLRPYDAIFPYRLEMQAKVAIGECANLYEFWGKMLADYTISLEQETLLVLSSEEYAKVVTRNLPNTVVIITPKFLDTKPSGKVGQVPIYNKQMRGVMARWMIDNRVEDATRLLEFAEHGYRYDAERSTPDGPVFTRTIMQPLILPLKPRLQSGQ